MMNHDSYFLASPSLKHALHIPLVGGSRKAIGYLNRCLFQTDHIPDLSKCFFPIHSSCNTRIETGRSIIDSFGCLGILDRTADSLHGANSKFGAFGSTLVHPLTKLPLIRGPSSAKHLPRFR